MGWGWTIWWIFKEIDFYGGNIMIKEKLFNLLTNNFSLLVKEIENKFLPLLHENATTLHPRRLKELITEEITAFLNFLKNEDLTKVKE